MGMLIISAVFVAIISATAYRANTRFRRESRLPMQWGITGAVNWSAPRPIALAFMPLLALVTLGLQTFISMNFQPRAGQEGLVLPVLIGSGVMLIAAQRFHFWLIEKTLRRNIG